MNSAEKVQLETPNLVLKCPTLDDAGRFARLASDKDIAWNRCSLPYPVSIEWAKDYLRHVIHNFGDKSFSFGIYRKNEVSQVFVGEILLSSLYEGEPALAYWLGKQHWGQGFASEASRAVVAFTFSRLGAPMLEADYFLDNPASGTILHKCGFQPAGQKLFWSSARQKFSAGQSMLLTREDWAKTGQAKIGQGNSI